MGNRSHQWSHHPVRFCNPLIDGRLIGGGCACFGSRMSQVRILSPRPFLTFSSVFAASSPRASSPFITFNRITDHRSGHTLQHETRESGASVATAIASFANLKCRLQFSCGAGLASSPSSRSRRSPRARCFGNDRGFRCPSRSHRWCGAPTALAAVTSRYLATAWVSSPPDSLQTTECRERSASARGRPFGPRARVSE